MVKYRLKELIAKKELEQGKRITLTQLSKDLDISRSVLSKIANSRGNIRVNSLKRIAEFFDVGLDDLIIDFPIKSDNVQKELN